MVLDASRPHAHRAILTAELESVGVRLNRRPPSIYLRRRKTGGLIDVIEGNRRYIRCLCAPCPSHASFVLLRGAFTPHFMQFPACSDCAAIQELPPGRIGTRSFVCSIAPCSSMARP